MALGTGAIQSRNVPAEPFVIDPDAFASMTTRNEAPIEAHAAPFSTIGGMTWQKQLPSVGIISRLRIQFTGSVTATTGNQWQCKSGFHWYDLLESVSLAVNGQNNLWSCNGLDLAALRHVRNPASQDLLTSTIGYGGDTPESIEIVWDLPIAMDDTSLVGALFAQSGATNITLDRTVAPLAKIFADPSKVADFHGTFHTSITRFTVPRAASEGSPLVIPDLTRLHAFNAIELPVTATGDVRLDLIRSAGSLARLFVSGRNGGGPLLANMTALRLEYGNAQRPYDYDPIMSLLAQNNNNYGSTMVPGLRVVLDFVRDNAPRDMVLLQGVTDLALVPTIAAGTTLTNATARLVQETLF